MTDHHHEPDVEGILREAAKAGAKEAKVSLNDTRLRWIGAFVLAIAIIAGWYFHKGTVAVSKAEKINAAEQLRFERASVANCQSVATIVNTFDGYLQAQIDIVSRAKDIPESRRDATISNYRSHFINPPNCSTLVNP